MAYAQGDSATETRSWDLTDFGVEGLAWRSTRWGPSTRRDDGIGVHPPCLAMFCRINAMTPHGALSGLRTYPFDLCYWNPLYSLHSLKQALRGVAERITGCIIINR